ncbi:restriction endonuclease [Halopseudomonas pertucinogena]|uniref:Membrane protein n=1 Tax=Halopseudomonas pertucinogena TaxID=86175 RepID=A0ABQ2CJ90_9GAMM|nr:restriction endonuclease [Halopseudomonas pertucinogena]GGI91616.1 membrane protein [Halopseudomonas pertucinogena]
MARRKRTSGFEDLINIMARLPWWACLGIALLSWLILSSIASRPMDVSGATLDQVGGIVMGQLLRTFAYGGQYLLPFACVLAAISSVVSRVRRKKLLADVQAATQPGKAIDGLNWRQFEQLVGEAFRRQGYSITETGGNGPDGGVDLVLRKDSEKYLVQCKHWRSLKVGVAVIREFFGAMAVEGAAGGFVVTSGRFTKEAQGFASGRNIQLVDGIALKQWVTQHKAQQTGPVAEPAAITQPLPPSCPNCNATMIKRTAKRGANAGDSFWGCSDYPRCKSVVNI